MAVDETARAAQEKYDNWVCQHGTAQQKQNVGKHNGSRVRCDDANVDPVTQAEREVAAARDRMNAARDVYDRARTGDYSQFPTQTEVPGPPLNLPSRANQKQNIFNRAFDPKTRKIIVLLIAGFLLYLALTTYE